MKLLADENVSALLIRRLRDADFDVYTIVESHPGISDIEVLTIAAQSQRLLLTEDKDFGELV